MHPRHPPPRLWLMTDERQGEALWAALTRLPRGSGVVFRHYGLPRAERRAVFVRVQTTARRRRLMLVLAGEERMSRAWRADGWHSASAARTARFRTASVHTLPELRAAERAGTALAFLSPAFPTRSHPGARALGRVRFGLIARQSRIPIVALGGMDARRGAQLPFAFGWAAIDAWSESRLKPRSQAAAPRTRSA